MIFKCGICDKEVRGNYKYRLCNDCFLNTIEMPRLLDKFITTIYDASWKNSELCESERDCQNNYGGEE